MILWVGLNSYYFSFILRDDIVLCIFFFNPLAKHNDKIISNEILKALYRKIYIWLVIRLIRVREF